MCGPNFSAAHPLVAEISLGTKYMNLVVVQEER